MLSRNAAPDGAVGRGTRPAVAEVRALTRAIQRLLTQTSGNIRAEDITRLRGVFERVCVPKHRVKARSSRASGVQAGARVQWAGLEEPIYAQVELGTRSPCGAWGELTLSDPFCRASALLHPCLRAGYAGQIGHDVKGGLGDADWETEARTRVRLARCIWPPHI